MKGTPTGKNKFSDNQVHLPGLDGGDEFQNLYKGEISKSGVPILPSKRARKIPEKIHVSNEDLAELQKANEPSLSEPAESTNEDEESDVSLDEIKEEEVQADEQVDQEPTNS